MSDLGRALHRQAEEIEELKNCRIYSFRGYGKKAILVFNNLPHFPDEGSNPVTTQNRIDSGYYTSIEDFDSYHTPDISFDDLYSGDDLKVYKKQTMLNLIELGKAWRKRVSVEYPEAELTILVHKEHDEWYLDVFNYSVEIENAIYC